MAMSPEEKKRHAERMRERRRAAGAKPRGPRMSDEERNRRSAERMRERRAAAKEKRANAPSDAISVEAINLKDASMKVVSAAQRAVIKDMVEVAADIPVEKLSLIVNGMRKLKASAPVQPVQPVASVHPVASVQPVAAKPKKPLSKAYERKMAAKFEEDLLFASWEQVRSLRNAFWNNLLAGRELAKLSAQERNEIDWRFTEWNQRVEKGGVNFNRDLHLKITKAAGVSEEEVEKVLAKVAAIEAEIMSATPKPMYGHRPANVETKQDEPVQTVEEVPAQQVEGPVAETVVEQVAEEPVTSQATDDEIDWENLRPARNINAQDVADEIRRENELLKELGL